MDLQVAGIANILPLDYTFVLDERQDIEGAKREIKLLELPLAGQPRVSFQYVSFQRSGGGKVANILAFLGSTGHEAALCGAVGDDEVGRLVRNDLAACGVSVEYITSLPGRNTRVVFVLSRPKTKKSQQVHRRRSPVAALQPSMLEGLSPSQFLVVGKATKGIIRCAERLRGFGTIVSLNLAFLPWRSNVVDLLIELLQLTSIVVIWEPALAKLGSILGLDGRCSAADIAAKTAANLTVVYGGQNRVSGVVGPEYQSVSLDSESDIEVRDSTGMMECFHAALISFLLEYGWDPDDRRLFQAAMGYANEVAAIQGRGTGARSFPSPFELEQVRIRYGKAASDLNEFCSCFISYSHKDKPFAQRLHDELQAHDISCWLDEHDLKPGDRILDVVRDAIGSHDKILLCCSDTSLNSWWVKDEIEKALERERRERRDIIIPLNLDGYLLDGWESGLASTIRSRLAADFTGWEHHNAKFDEQFERVVKALRTDEEAREKAPEPKL